MEYVEEFRLPLEYVGLGKFIIKGFCPDFVDQANKFIVEIFGNYYHYQPAIRKRDMIRLKTYEKYGYRCIVLWASELEDRGIVMGKLSMLYGDLSKY